MERLAQPQVDESTLMYRNPLGVKGGKNKILLGAGMAALAALLVAVGVFYIVNANVPLGVVLLCVAGVYAALCAVNVYRGVKMLARPYAVLIDASHLILREKESYLHLPLVEMRRLTIDCEGIDAYLNVNPDGSYDVLIKGENLFYTVNGVQSCITSRNMRKIAFILNSIALNAEVRVNWGQRFDELLSSAQVQAEGLTEGLNRELDKSAQANAAKTAEKVADDAKERNSGADTDSSSAAKDADGDAEE